MRWTYGTKAYPIGIEDIWTRVWSVRATKRRRDENVPRRGSVGVSSEDIQARRPEVRALQTVLLE